MPKITKKETKNFLDKITRQDRTAIIHHDDADGFCSAILLNNYLKKKKIKTTPFVYTIGKTNLEKLPLKKFTKIIITDIATEVTRNQIKSLKQKDILYIDHHPKFPLPSSVKYLITNSKTYIPTSRTIYEILGGHKFISIIGTMADAGHRYKENQKFIYDYLKNQKETLEEFNEKYAYPYSDTIVYLNKSPKKAFKKLSKIHSKHQIKNLKKYSIKIEKEIQKSLGQANKTHEKINGINIYQINPKHPIKGIVAAKIVQIKPKEIHILLSPKKSNKNILGISARHQSAKANLPKLLKTAIKNLPNSNSGGHPRASGGQIRKQDFQKFKQNIKNYSKSRPNI